MSTVTHSWLLLCSSILEEMMKMVLLGVVLWAGVTFGSHVAPYPLNLILSTGKFYLIFIQKYFKKNSVLDSFFILLQTLVILHLCMIIRFRVLKC